jgi:uncharacterized protein YbcC (UPF0753/DUF2309 family)
MLKNQTEPNHLLDQQSNVTIANARQVCLRIPPVWELENYVAVNPFMGFIDQPIETAIPIIEKGLSARMLPGGEMSASSSLSPLEKSIDRWISEWMASFVANDEWPSLSLYASWRNFSLSDQTLESAGLTCWRKWLLQSPMDATEVLSRTKFDLSERDLEELQYRLLGRQYGWACLLRRQTWGNADEEPRLLLELLAVLVLVETIVKNLRREPTSDMGPTKTADSTKDRLATLVRSEDEYVSKLARCLLSPVSTSLSTLPSVQAVFCIDVRSERLRRGLERFEEVQTLGFAGFFGITLDIINQGSSSPRCPVLLKPSTQVKGVPRPANFAKYLAAAPSKFMFVELTGLMKVASLVKGVTARRTPPSIEETVAIEYAESVPLKERVLTAAAILTNTGLASRLARVVILCGHTSCSENNAQSAGLECGACGGHGGAMNARVAASWLNDPMVRSSLQNLGHDIPFDTIFIPAVHDTSSDEVRFLDPDALSGLGDEGSKIRNMFETASKSVRSERAKSLGLADEPDKSLLSVFRQRAADWSEVCPEWGLARNASFIIGRRARTRGVDLDGRAFLHDYDQSVLTMILSAPMVVASWINWQYFASTVDNDRFGAGPKPLQNPIGSLGLVKGHHGDFCTGLSRESVHLRDGTWFHEPLRLQVLVEAQPYEIDKAIDQSQMVTQLADNGWVRIFSLDRESQRLSLRGRGGIWHAFKLKPMTSEDHNTFNEVEIQ